MIHSPNNLSKKMVLNQPFTDLQVPFMMQSTIQYIVFLQFTANIHSSPNVGIIILQCRCGWSQLKETPGSILTFTFKCYFCLVGHQQVFAIASNRTASTDPTKICHITATFEDKVTCAQTPLHKMQSPCRTAKRNVVSHRKTL